jgi:hypothetical protein
VYQEVQDFNLRLAQAPVFRGLVRPTDAEETLNGYKLRPRQQIDWQEQFDRAVDAFVSNRVLVLVNERQADSLDERVIIAPDVEVSFLKLVPLVGG